MYVTVIPVRHGYTYTSRIYLHTTGIPVTVVQFLRQFMHGIYDARHWVYLYVTIIRTNTSLVSQVCRWLSVYVIVIRVRHGYTCMSWLYIPLRHGYTCTSVTGYTYTCTSLLYMYIMVIPLRHGYNVRHCITCTSLVYLYVTVMQLFYVTAWLCMQVTGIPIRHCYTN